MLQKQDIIEQKLDDAIKTGKEFKIPVQKKSIQPISVLKEEGFVKKYGGDVEPISQDELQDFRTEFNQRFEDLNQKFEKFEKNQQN